MTETKPKQVREIAPVLSQAIRLALTRPVTVWVTIGATIFTVALAPGSFMGDLSFSARLAINTVNAFAFWSFTYWALGPWIAVGLVRNIPWAPMQVVFYTPFAAANTILYSIFLADVATLGTTLAGFGAVMAMVFVTVLFTLLIFQAYLDAALEQVGFGGWLFRRNTRVGASASTRPDPERPLLMRAANQYVEVYQESGVDLVRTTFKAAVERQTVEAGFQINRSTWVAWEGVTSVVRDRDRLCLTLWDGSTAYVSRGTVEAFEVAWRGVLEKRAPTNWKQ